MCLYKKICSYENIYRAYKKARKGKTLKKYVVNFENNLKENFLSLRTELLFHTYKPKPLQTFILRDPQTRRINKSAFRDRIVHHALCNVVGPFFEKSFIYDSFANQKGKGTFKSIKRFSRFCKKVSNNNTKKIFVMKADIKKYFENVDHEILLKIIKKKISDSQVLWLIKAILRNYGETKGMPLGNLTSQFFANVYLNGLDWFVKHELKAKYYLRYVDDFAIIHFSPKLLENYMKKIDSYLKLALQLELHPLKSKIIYYNQGIEFLGMRIFPSYRLLKGKNLRKFQRKLNQTYSLFEKGLINYDRAYDFIEGWSAYAKNANTYNLRQNYLQEFERRYPLEISTKEVNRLLRKERRKIKHKLKTTPFSYHNLYKATNSLDFSYLATITLLKILIKNG